MYYKTYINQEISDAEIKRNTNQYPTLIKKSVHDLPSHPDKFKYVGTINPSHIKNAHVRPAQIPVVPK